MALPFLKILPIVLTLVSLLTPIVVYFIPYIKGVRVVLPFPTDIIDEQPMKGVKISGVLLATAFAFMIVNLRHLQVEKFHPRCTGTNLISLLVGYFMIIGECISIAFSLQDHRLLHNIGIALCSGCRCGYIILQTYITHKCFLHHVKALRYLRLLLSVVTCFTTPAFAISRFFFYWQKYQVPQILSWTLFIVYLTCMCSFAYDLRKLKMEISSINIKEQQNINENQLILISKEERRISNA